MRAQGFTLIELIMIIIIVGILAVYVAPRIGGSQDVEVTAAQISLVSMLRLQQQRAMQDTANPGLYGVRFDSAVFTAEPSGSGETLSVTGLTLNIEDGWSIRFNALGCAGNCGGGDIRVEFSSGSHLRCVLINEQGYISTEPC